MDQREYPGWSMKGNLDGIPKFPFTKSQLLWGSTLVQVAMVELTQIIAYVYAIMYNQRLKLIL